MEGTGGLPFGHSHLQEAWMGAGLVRRNSMVSGNLLGELRHCQETYEESQSRMQYDDMGEALVVVRDLMASLTW